MAGTANYLNGIVYSSSHDNKTEVILDLDRAYEIYGSKVYDGPLAKEAIRFINTPADKRVVLGAQERLRMFQNSAEGEITKYHTPDLELRETHTRLESIAKKEVRKAQ